MIRELADFIAGKDLANGARHRFIERFAAEKRPPPGLEEAAELAALLEGAYPALARDIAARPRDVLAIARGTKLARDARAYRRIASAIGDHDGELDGDKAKSVRRGLRAFASRERLRIAARELLPHAGSDVDTTSRELSDLADVCAEVALAEALGWAEARFGVPLMAAGARCPFVVIGMGKLGGRELNCGSDIDLMLFYETDEGHVEKGGIACEQTLHEHFTRVAQRFASTLEEVTDDGFVWRVDLRLRPEGSKGPLVNALAAAERYYETWGRTWERAALVRARPIAGDLAFGACLLEALSPFIWRRAVDPRIADEMATLLVRSRTEGRRAPEGSQELLSDRDLKIGAGGIREVEFFAQSLQLIWGGREPAVRSTNTMTALRRLRARGYVTDREGREMADAYLTLRRLEHRVQFATGLQTHALPSDPDLLERMARSLGFATAQALLEDLARTREKVSERFASLAAGARAVSEATLDPLFAALDARDEAGVLGWLGASASPDLARHLLALGRRPDSPLGASTRDKMPALAPILIDALMGAADPEQATRFMAAFFSRFPTPTVYARALADDPRATRRLASLFGASAQLGASLVAHPELLDRLLFGSGEPTAETARAAVDEEIASLPPCDLEDAHEFVGALRRVKERVTMEVGLADLAGELATSDCTRALSAMADATLAHALRFAMAERGVEGGLVVVAMGKLGGGEIGYGSDLDIFFVYDPKSARLVSGQSLDPDEAAERFVRIAQRVLRLVGMPHDDGPGYELDTRLRPSGNQGLLVVSLDSLIRYHDAGGAGQDWERQALVKTRIVAGDPELGARVVAAARAIAYERGAPPAERMHHLRMRMERELGHERRQIPGSSGGWSTTERQPPRARFDIKVGRGGLVDVEFAVQWLQMKYGVDPRVVTTETEVALSALEAYGYLDAAIAAQLSEGYRFLRRLEQRLRVLHGTSAHLIEDGAPGLALLARRMGMRDGPRGSASEGLLARYVEVTRDVRAGYLAALGLDPSAG